MTTSDVRDPITFELLKNNIATIVDEMSLTMVRTSYSANIREAMDFSTAMCDAKGEMVAQGLCIALHLGSIPDAMLAVIAKFEGAINPGDVFIMNDPYSGGMHLPDIFLFKPLFDGDRRIGFLVIVADQLDIGGRTPGGRAVDSTEIYQEGLRLPALKLYDRGVANDAIWEILEANVRVSGKVLGDIRSMLAAFYVAEKSLRELIDKYGLETVLGFFDEVLGYSERLTRAEIAALPDGHYHFVDHIDDDSVGDDPIRIEVALDVRGDELFFDLAGTSPQVKGAINATFSFTKSAIYAAVRTLMPPDLPNNGGFFRPIHVQAPPGTIVNPLLPSPVASRGVTGFRVVDAALGVLAQAAPARVAAAGEGGASSFRMGGYVPGRGGYVVWDSMIGTWGARPDRDGIDGCAAFSANMSNVPVEVIEAEFPVRVGCYGLRADSGGAGKFRGGLGLMREWHLLSGEATLTMRSDRRKFRPWGLFGGQPGASSLNVLNPDGEARVLPTKIVTRVKEGDVFRHLMSSGGGYGDPLERDPELVWWDWRDGKVTLEHARDAYGVAIDPQRKAVDAEATAALRARLRSAR